MLDYGFDNFTNLPVDTTDRTDTLLFPTQFYHLIPDNTATDKHEITVPTSVPMTDVSVSGTVDGQNITHTYTWHDATVGTFTAPVSPLFASLTDPASVSYQSAKEMPRLLKSAHAKSTVDSTDTESAAPGILGKLFTNLTPWQLGLSGILLIAIILYIIILIRTIIRSIQRRKRRRRKARRRAAKAHTVKKKS